MSDQVQQAAERLMTEVAYVPSTNRRHEGLYSGMYDDVETVTTFAQAATARLAAAEAEIARLKEALRQSYGYAAAIQRMTAFPAIGFRCSLIREVISRALPDAEAKQLHDETEIILDARAEGSTVDPALSWPGEAPLSESEQAEERRVMEEARRCYRCRMDPIERGGTIYIRVQIDGRWQNVACCRECWDLHHARQGGAG